MSSDEQRPSKGTSQDIKNSVTYAIHLLAFVKRLPPSRMFVSFASVLARAYFMVGLGVVGYFTGLSWYNVVDGIKTRVSGGNVTASWMFAIGFSGVACFLAYCSSILHGTRAKAKAKAFAAKWKAGNVDVTKIVQLPAAVWVMGVNEFVDSMLFVAAVLTNGALVATISKGSETLTCGLSWAYLVILYVGGVAWLGLFNSRLAALTAEIFVVASDAVLVQQEAFASMRTQMTGGIRWLIGYAWIGAVDATINLYTHQQVIKSKGRTTVLWAVAVGMVAITSGYLVLSRMAVRHRKAPPGVLALRNNYFFSQSQELTKRALAFASTLSLVWAIQASLSDGNYKPSAELTGPVWGYVAYAISCTAIVGAVIPVLEYSLYKVEAELQAGTDEKEVPVVELVNVFAHEWYNETATVLKSAMSLIVAYAWNAVVLRTGPGRTQLTFLLAYACGTTAAYILLTLLFTKVFPELSDAEKVKAAVSVPVKKETVKELVQSQTAELAQSSDRAPLLGPTSPAAPVNGVNEGTAREASEDSR